MKKCAFVYQGQRTRCGYNIRDPSRKKNSEHVNWIVRRLPLANVPLGCHLCVDTMS